MESSSVAGMIMMEQSGKGGRGRGGSRLSATEREKTKLRERQRRSITTKIFSGLRKHGGYNLPPRADINDVLRALATEAGFIVRRHHLPTSSTSAGKRLQNPRSSATVHAACGAPIWCRSYPKRMAVRSVQLFITWKQNNIYITTMEGRGGVEEDSSITASPCRMPIPFMPASSLASLQTLLSG